MSVRQESGRPVPFRAAHPSPSRCRSSLTPTTRVSRRALARGIGWSVPVLAISAAAPALALSCPEPITRTATLILNPVEPVDSLLPTFSGDVTGDVPLPAGTQIVVTFGYDLYDDSAEAPDVPHIQVDVMPSRFTVETEGAIAGAGSPTHGSSTPSDDGGDGPPDSRGAWVHAVSQTFTYTAMEEILLGTTVTITPSAPVLEPATGTTSLGYSGVGQTNAEVDVVKNADGCVVSSTTVSTGGFASGGT